VAVADREQAVAVRFDRRVERAPLVHGRRS
jgi:hypothetical protein